MTKKFYLVGENIQKSYSPHIHKMIYRHLNIDADYFLFEPSKHADFKNANGGLILPNDFEGLNITHPYKKQIIDLIYADISGCGSVNTVKRWDVTGDKLFGYSTDGDGFVMDAQRLKKDLSDVLIVGTGGAARAIACAVKEHHKTELEGDKEVTVCTKDHSGELDTKVSVFSRDPIRAERFAKELGTSVYQKNKRYSLVINCTPAPLAVDFFCAKGYYDLDYKSGDGLGMLIYQAMLADMLFFGKEIDLNLFDTIYKEIKKLQ